MGKLDESEGSVALAAIELSQVKKAKALGVSRTAVSKLEKGEIKPLDELASKLFKLWGIAPTAWRRAPPAPVLPNQVERATPVLPTRAVPNVVERLTARAARRGNTVDPPATLLEGMRLARKAGLTDSELLPANQIEMRAIATRIDEALETLTERERVVCHVGFREMRKALVELLAVDPQLHAGILEALPDQPTAGAVVELRACRKELERLQTSLRTEAAARMALGNVQRASKFDVQANTVARLLKKATLGGSTLKELFGTDTWKQAVFDTGAVLRADLEALECAKETLAPLTEPFAVEMLRELKAVSQITWPCVRFQKDIEGFFYYILGCKPWDRQRELLLNVQDNDWNACASGHRVSKSYSVAGIALWFYSSFPNARVFITAPTDRQLNEVVWRELKMRIAESGVCFDCKEFNKTATRADYIHAPCNHSAKIEGYVKESAKGGMHSDDFRQVSGFTAKDAESTAGLAGENIMFIVEEASGVGTSIFIALKGNLAGGGHLLLVGNPTRNEGEFYDAFYRKQKSDDETQAQHGNYKTMRISSLETPNCVEGRVVVKGLATLEWCEARKLEWGEDSAFYKVRVLGLHALGEDGKLFSMQLISEAEERFEDVLDDGPLFIGIDPAGPSGVGDESAFAARRGQRILKLYAKRGLDEDGHLSEALNLLRELGRPGETATVNIDSEGVGAGIVSRFRQYEASNPGVMRVFGIRSSSNAQREPLIYDRWRDELAGNMASWMRAGGAIPTDLKLGPELHALELKMKLTPKGERSKLTPKDVLIKVLHRSPDRYDACALACWEQRVLEELPPAPEGNQRGRGESMDPYAGAAGNRGAIDPYG